MVVIDKLTVILRCPLAQDCMHNSVKFLYYIISTWKIMKKFTVKFVYYLAILLIDGGVKIYFFKQIICTKKYSIQYMFIADILLY